MESDDAKCRQYAQAVDIEVQLFGHEI